MFDVVCGFLCLSGRFGRVFCVSFGEHELLQNLIAFKCACKINHWLTDCCVVFWLDIECFFCVLRPIPGPVFLVFLPI